MLPGNEGATNELGAECAAGALACESFDSLSVASFSSERMRASQTAHSALCSFASNSAACAKDTSWPARNRRMPSRSVVLCADVLIMGEGILHESGGISIYAPGEPTVGSI